MEQGQHELLGRTVAFVPAAFCAKGYIDEGAPVVRGEVVTVNVPHHTFTAKYGMFGRSYLEMFNLAQIGQEVTVCGRK